MLLPLRGHFETGRSRKSSDFQQVNESIRRKINTIEKYLVAVVTQTF
jgi:hypothetical protein